MWSKPTSALENPGKRNACYICTHTHTHTHTLPVTTIPQDIVYVRTPAIPCTGPQSVFLWWLWEAGRELLTRFISNNNQAMIIRLQKKIIWLTHWIFSYLFTGINRSEIWSAKRTQLKHLGYGGDNTRYIHTDMHAFYLSYIISFLRLLRKPVWAKDWAWSEGDQEI